MYYVALLFMGLEKVNKFQLCMYVNEIRALYRSGRITNHAVIPACAALGDVLGHVRVDHRSLDQTADLHVSTEAFST